MTSRPIRRCRCGWLSERGRRLRRLQLSRDADEIDGGPSSQVGSTRDLREIDELADARRNVFSRQLRSECRALLRDERRSV